MDHLKCMVLPRNTLTMTRGWNGLFFCRVWMLLLFAVCTVCDTYRMGYEAVDYTQMNWTSAVVQYAGTAELLSRISNIDELCDAQPELSTVSEYWTALKRDQERRTYHWGLNQSVDILIDAAELLDETQPGDCYVISTSAMKLKSKNCNSLQGVLISFIYEDNSTPNPERYSDKCSEYKVLPRPWSCKIVSGMSIGNCQVETSSLDCCKKYCKSGNQTYSIKTRISDLSVKVRKVPKAFPSNVEIEFNTSNKVNITREVFNDTERVVVVSIHRSRVLGTIWTLNNNDTLFSDVIGVELSPSYKKMIPNLIIIQFSHAKVPQGDVKRQCVFWEEDVMTSNGSWSRDGCTVLDASSLESTLCSCNHLTNFAVLMQFRPQQISNVHEVSLSIITYIGCALSLTGETLVVFIYIVFMRLKAEGIQIRINLAAALFVAQVVFLSGIDATNNKPVCVLVAVLLHYFYLASFGWMLLEGVFLYIMVVEVFSTVNLRYLYFFAWGYPIIPVIISLVIGSKDDGGLQNYTNKNFCWLSFSKHLSWSFIGPVLLISIINFVILVAVLREIRNLQEPNPSTLKAFKKGLKACVILSPLLGLTWVFGLLAVTDAGLTFQYIFTILNSTQGMVIFLLHVLRNSDVRAAIHHKLLKWRLDRFPISSANRVHEDASQTTSRRKRQDDPEADSKNQLQNIQAGEQVTLSLQTPPPRVH